ncbi:right-handed parallel beta-helix repeat-containing protein [Ammoniphilus sp. YIM 78166]|uniref:right-handed parallel beta-helix repeat-containing protein n=1 Tax=Ammoniphilus sp. YIM 78166 TaxID=1644106 RepID=UPI001070473C|nr:right-handed parallel beta-helix repeat-containing protein [Ammoniphilus sp. YIM 78166]
MAIKANLGDLCDLDLTSRPPTDKDVLTYDSIQSKWIPKAPDAYDRSLGSYVLELDRWNVKNDGTDAVNTSKGINEALIWASQKGYVEVVLPRGKYLIDENNPIEPQSFMTLNLGGSTLRIRDNSLELYSIVKYQRNQRFCRITNGIIEGDKDTHDYSNGGTHEGGYGIAVGSFTPPSDGGNNVRYLSIDNLEINNCTGDAISLNSTFGQIFPTPSQFNSSFEQGGISTADGTLTMDTKKIRSKLKIDMKQPAIVKYGYFGLYGNGYGALGSEITGYYYDVIFYKNDDSFLSAKPRVQFFDEVEVPVGASYAKVVIHQPTVPSSDKSLINVRTASFPQHIYIEKCELHHCRRQGISVSGSKHLYIRENSIHHIKGTDPQGGIDVEDGVDLNQFIYIEANSFHDNHGYDVIIVNGKYIVISRNRITSVEKYVSLGVNAGADKIMIRDNQIHNAKIILSGEVTFSGNHVYGSRTQILGSYHKEISISDSLFYNCVTSIDNPFSYNVRIDGCRFFNDYDKQYAFSSFNWSIEFRKEPQFFSNCSFEGTDTYYLNYILNGTKGGWKFENCLFKKISQLGFPGGTYSNCRMEDIGTIGTGSVGNTNSIEFRGCKIISTDPINSLFTINNMQDFRLIDCFIEKPNGHLLRIQNANDKVMIKGNIINYSNDTLNRPVILIESTYTGRLIAVENNTISASRNQLAVENNLPGISMAQVVIRNNVMTGATLRYAQKELVQNNIINGEIDPYYKSSTEPVTGYYALSQEVRNSNPMPGGFIGWICVKAGYANSETWAPNKSYSKGSRIHSGGHVYEALNSGTSHTTPPIFPTGSGSTVMDNNIMWQQIGFVAVFKTFGSISS